MEIAPQPTGNDDTLKRGGEKPKKSSPMHSPIRLARTHVARKAIWQRRGGLAQRREEFTDAT